MKDNTSLFKMAWKGKRILWEVNNLLAVVLPGSNIEEKGTIFWETLGGEVAEWSKVLHLIEKMNENQKISGLARPGETKKIHLHF